jgi:hypothetical protein
MNEPRESTLWDIWRWPVLLGLLTAVGLAGALFSDGGLGDLLAGLCLWAPALAGLWYGWGPRR